MNILRQAARIPGGVDAVKTWLGEDGVTVDQETAQRRADMCLRCPKHEVGSIVVEATADAIRRYLAIKNDLELRVSGEKSLHSCGVCWCVMRLKIWEPISIVKKKMTTEDFNNFAVPCWQRDEKP